MRLYLNEYIQGALHNLWAFKLRSALMLLSMLIGTASVVALIASGQLATQHALSQFTNLGTDLFAINIENKSLPLNSSVKKLNVSQIALIKNSSDTIKIVAPYTVHYSSIFYKNRLLSGSMLGVTTALKDILNIKVENGRFISFLDNRQLFCVLGNAIAQEMISGDSEDLLGQQIRLGNTYCTVIGVVKPTPENIFMYADINRAIIMPLEASLQLDKSVQIQNILFKLMPNADINQTQQKIETTVNQLLPEHKVFSHSARQLIDSMEKQRLTFTLMLGAIGGISLVVAGIGVMNIMLMSVTERRREIGIRMALGARNKDVQRMFLIEATALTLIGGVAGILVGELLSWALALVNHWQFSFYIFPPLLGFSVATLVGILSGYYPAYKAAQLDPVKTLRSN